MKKICTSFFAILIFVFELNAQCTVNAAAQTTPGVNPQASSCPCVVRGLTYNQTLQGKIQASKDTTFTSPIPVTIHIVVDSVRLDSIQGLPTGITWTKTPNVLQGGGNGAVCFNGITNAPTGTYNLTGYGMVWLRIQNSQFGIDSPYVYSGNLEQFSPFGGYYLSVVNPGDPCHGVSALGVSLGNNQTVCSGTLVTLTPTTYNGQTPYSYSWSGTGNTLSCNSCASPTVTITQNSTYTVTVTDGASATATSTISYTVQQTVTPSVSVSPASPSVCSSSSVNFTATPSNGGASPTYAWLLNNTGTGVAGSSYTLSNPANGDVVTCVLTSTATCASPPTVNSNAATVSLSNYFTTQPANTNPQIGNTALFTVAVSNASSTYRWQLNSGTGFSDLSNAGSFSGVTTNTLTVSNVQASFNNYNFRCIVSSPVSCEDTSNVATLNVGALDIRDFGVDKVAVFPNPATGNIYFNLPDEKVTTVEIYEIKGAIVKQFNNPELTGQMNIDITNLQSGMYFMLLKGAHTYRGKFVKE